MIDIHNKKHIQVFISYLFPILFLFISFMASVLTIYYTLKLTSNLLALANNYSLVILVTSNGIYILDKIKDIMYKLVTKDNTLILQQTHDLVVDNYAPKSG